MKREDLRQWFTEWINDYYDELHLEDDLTPEVAESVLAALRPVSREQVEKVRSNWITVTEINGKQYSKCANCQNCLDGIEDAYLFCPACGAPMTDEAVQMVMERLEALHGETETD